MSLGDNYPRLDQLARNEGNRSLEDLAWAPSNAGPWLDLQHACALAVRQYPRLEIVADQLSYLATLEEFLRQFNEAEAPRRDVWRKISVAGKESEFLNTVSEAALAIQFRSLGSQIVLERPFDPTARRTSKNADIVITNRDGSLTWLDAISAQKQPKERSREETLALFVKIAAGKYDAKFRDAVDRGLVDDVGVLVCIVKNEDLIEPFLTERSVPDPPSSFWRENPKLSRVAFHTLYKGQGGTDVLAPALFALWKRPLGA